MSRRPSLRLPLWIKVWLLLGVNFALLLALGAGWFLARDQQGWERLALGPLGDRVAASAEQIAVDLWEVSPQEAHRLLTGHAEAQGVDFIWLRNDGLVLAGPELPLPRPVQDELSRNEVERDGPPDLDGPPPRGGRPGPARANGVPGRILFRDDRGDFWFGVRLHPTPAALNASRPPPRTTLIIHATSSWQFARLLGLHWWLGGAGLALGISVLFWLPFVRSVTRRLEELTRTTDRIADGDFQARVNATGTDEIGQLGGSINALASRLASHAETQKRFLGDVAHELGSPIGRLQVAIELLEQRASPELRESVDDVRDDVKAMAELVNELLAFTRAGLRARSAELRPVPLAPLAAAVLLREDPQRQVLVRIPPDLAVLADATLLQRALGNLVRNAIRYGGTRPINLRAAARSDDQVEISVEDEGPGVPPKALPRLGEPFFRPENARARESGGVGLGLAIVRNAVAACGGEVVFANRQPTGFCATVRLTMAR